MKCARHDRADVTCELPAQHRESKQRLAIPAARRSARARHFGVCGTRLRSLPSRETESADRDSARLTGRTSRSRDSRDTDRCREARHASPARPRAPASSGRCARAASPSLRRGRDRSDRTGRQKPQCTQVSTARAIARPPGGSESTRDPMLHQSSRNRPSGSRTDATRRPNSSSAAAPINPPARRADQHLTGQPQRLQRVGKLRSNGCGHDTNATFPASA